MKTFNIYTGLWIEKKIPTINDVMNIVGEKTPIVMDAGGNITIDKELTDKEKTLIEGLSLL